MSHPKAPKKYLDQAGLTIIELMVVMVAGSIIALGILQFFASNYSQYLRMQQDSIKFNELSLQSQRVTKVLRGSVDILEATPTTITVYAYFTPRDATVSKIKYYYDSVTKKLMADVTPMSAAPPGGTPITAQLKTYTIITSYFYTVGNPIFEYLDSGSNTLSSVSNLRDIKGIRFVLTVPPTFFATSKNTTITSEIALRNRKTNL